MIKKFIKGHPKRGAEVIQELEKLGGINSGYNGSVEGYLYFIDKGGWIDSTESTSKIADILIETFEEIKLDEEPYKVKVKEPKPIYWFRATEDRERNQALFDKLNDLVGKDKRNAKMANGIVVYNPVRDSIEFSAFNCSAPIIELQIIMMVGQELVIDDEQV